MLENSLHMFKYNMYKDMIDSKSFKLRVNLLMGRPKMYVFLLTVYNVLYVRSIHFMHSVLFCVTTSSLFFTYQLTSLSSIIHLRHVGE